MKKIKIGLGILVAGILVFSGAIQVKGFLIPASEEAKEEAIAPANSPVIGDSWELTPEPHYISSENPVLKTLFGVNQEFPGAFSTMLTKKQVQSLRDLGVEVRQVGIRKITGKPVCGDSVCQGNEPKRCPQDCPSDPDPEPDRTCLPGDQKPWGINKVNGGEGGNGVTVAVLDTGVDQDHLDLMGNLTDCVSKVTHFKPDRKSCEDAHGHGTHVSGTILANSGEDGLGIYGVAPEAKLMTVKVCDRRGSCYGDDSAAGIRYAADHGANIISMSYGGDDPDSQELAAIDYAVSKGVLVVVAAGNDGPTYDSINYPAAYYKAVAVGAINSSEAVPDWSSRGVNDGDYLVEEREVELATPGVSVESAYKNGCYAYMSGTSMATPHVSGLAAKLWQGSANNTRNYLHGIAAEIWTTGDDTATGFGLPIAP